MLDIQKELEKFNRLLEEVDEEVGRSSPDPEPAADEITDASHVVEVTDAHDALESDAHEEYQETYQPPYVSADDTANAVGDWPTENAGDLTDDVPVADEPVLESPEFDVPISGVVSSALEPVDEVADYAEDVDEFRTKYHAESYDEALMIASQAADRPWRLTEHVGPDIESDNPGHAEETPILDAPVEEDIGDAAGVRLSDVLIEENSAPLTDNNTNLSIDSPHVPNQGRSYEGFSVGDKPVDSLLSGVRSALTGSHRPRSKFGMPVTLKMSTSQGEDETSRWGGYARILPLMTFRSGIFEERLGMVLGAVAAAIVVLVGGVLVVPSLFSSDDGDVVAESAVSTSTDHIHASADPLANAEPATLSISTFPPGARVYLNAELIGVTPFQGINVESGNYQMSIEKTNYQSIDTLFVIDQPRQFFFDMAADVEVTEPDHLTLSVDETLSSSSVAESTSSTLERSEVVTESANTASVSEPRTVETRSSSSERRESSTRSRRTAREPAPPATGALIVTSEPMGATVLVDGDVVGETPLTLSDIEVGRVSLSMQKEGYVPYETDLTVVRSIQTPFHAALAPVKAALFVNASPGGDLYIDGRLMRSGITPGHMEMVSVGTREVRIVHPQYGDWTRSIEVTTDGKTSVSVDMVVHGYESGIENGDRLFNESRYAEAIEEYNRALSIRPGNRSIENKIGLAAKAMAESSMPSADSRTAPADGIYSVTDTPPQLIGGLEALHANVIYPDEAYKAGTQGRVYVQFVVDENGRAQDLTIARGLPNGCNDAAIRAVKRSRFKPATVAGVPVKARHTLFVNFTIE